MLIDCQFHLHRSRCCDSSRLWFMCVTLRQTHFYVKQGHTGRGNLCDRWSIGCGCGWGETENTYPHPQDSEFFSFVEFQYQSFPINSLTRWLFKFRLSCCFTYSAFFFNSKTLLFMKMVKWGLFSTPIRLKWVFRVQLILVSKYILTSNFRQIYASFQTECFPFNFDYN